MFLRGRCWDVSTELMKELHWLVKVQRVEIRQPGRDLRYWVSDLVVNFFTGYDTGAGIEMLPGCNGSRRRDPCELKCLTYFADKGGSCLFGPAVVHDSGL